MYWGLAGSVGTQGQKGYRWHKGALGCQGCIGPGRVYRYCGAREGMGDIRGIGGS